MKKLRRKKMIKKVQDKKNKDKSGMPKIQPAGKKASSTASGCNAIKSGEKPTKGC